MGTISARMGRSVFGTVYLRRGASGKAIGWYARFQEGGKRRNVYAGRTKDEAARFLAGKHLARLPLEELARRAGQPTLEAFLPLLREKMRATLRPTTVGGRLAILEATATHFGKVPMAAVSQGQAQAWLESRRLTAKREASTLRTYRGTLSSAWETAIALGLAQRNPWRKLSLPTPDESEVPRLERADLERLYAAMPEAIRAWVVLMGESGLRRTEAITLRRRDFGAKFETVTIEGNRAKSHRARTLPLGPRARAALEALPKREPDARMFPVHTRVAQRLFREAADAAGFPNVVPHHLRHALAVRLLEAGANLRDVRDVLGHASIVTTERYLSRAGRSGIARAFGFLEEG